MLKRMGWGLLALVVLLFIAFASMVRVTVHDTPALPSQFAGGTGKASATPPDQRPLIIPVAGVDVSSLRDNWGEARGDGAREHHATDIMAPLGTPVLAAASGRVEKLFESANGGHTIYIRSPDGGTVHYYAHLDSYGVAEGQLVHQGDPIATVGNTGSAASGAPHLHFEIKAMAPGEKWWAGTNVNPYPLLAAARRWS